jgi:hypothetical protein
MSRAELRGEPMNHILSSDQVVSSLAQGQVGANVVADPSLIAPHAPSAKTQTLQKKAFPVIDRHGPSVGIPQVGDEGLELSAVSKWKITDVVMGDAESDAFSDVHDRKLEELLQVWADLPESVKDALLVMVSDRSV